MTIRDVRFIRGAPTWAHLPDDGVPEAAFVGRSNVGKSSLLNMLVGRRAIARISNTPGKTQEFNYYLVNEAFYLVDVPGFGYAKVARQQREKWTRFIGQYLTSRETLRIVFHLVDSRHDPTALDRELILLMKGNPVLYVIALTKTDKLSGNGRAKAKKRTTEALAKLGMEVPIVLTSAENKTGRDDLLSWMEVAGLVHDVN